MEGNGAGRDGAAFPRVLLLVLVVGIGCASGRILPSLPHAFSTDRFDIHCSPDLGRAQLAAGWAEDLLSQMESTLGKLNKDIRPRIMLFTARAEFLELVGGEDPDLHGLFVWEAGQPEILLPLADCPLLFRETLAHELAHLCLARRYPSGVRWLVEGVCEYLEARLAADESDEGAEHVEHRLDALQQIREAGTRFRFSEDPVGTAWLVSYYLDEGAVPSGEPLQESVAKLLSLKGSDVEDVEKAFHAALADGLWKDRKPRIKR